MAASHDPFKVGSEAHRLLLVYAQDASCQYSFQFDDVRSLVKDRIFRLDDGFVAQFRFVVR